MALQYYSNDFHFCKGAEKSLTAEASQNGKPAQSAATGRGGDLGDREAVEEVVMIEEEEEGKEEVEVGEEVKEKEAEVEEDKREEVNEIAFTKEVVIDIQESLTDYGDERNDDLAGSSSNSYDESFFGSDDTKSDDGLDRIGFDRIGEQGSGLLTLQTQGQLTKQSKYSDRSMEW